MLNVSNTGSGSLGAIRFPALTRVEGGVRFFSTDPAFPVDTTHLALPALRVVAGEGFTLNVLDRLCTLEIGAIEQISKNLWVMAVPNLPASALEPLRCAAISRASVTTVYRSSWIRPPM